MADKMMAVGQQDALLAAVPVGHLSRSEVIANAVVFLCLIVGHTMVVDGGYSIQ